MELDLHGLNVEEATSKIEMALYSLDTSINDNELIVITGKGSGTMNMTFLNIIEKYDNYNCQEISSRNAYLITKKY
ncbi:MAG: Smr/MutS family protein [Mycoplasmataceae bacterium]|nr:Smr/MutS family protein [Mycoplasmataceae bacterium]